MSSYYPSDPADIAIYEALWRSAPVENGYMHGAQAVEFLRKSNVDLPILKQIWSFSTSAPTMDEEQFYVALRLIALAQYGFPLSRDIVSSTANRHDIRAPKFTGIQIRSPQLPPPVPSPKSQMNQNGGYTRQRDESSDSSIRSSRSVQISTPIGGVPNQPSGDYQRGLSKSKSQYSNPSGDVQRSPPDSFSPNGRPLNRGTSEFGLPSVSPAGGNVEVQRVVWIQDGMNSSGDQSPPQAHPKSLTRAQTSTSADFHARANQMTREGSLMQSSLDNIEIARKHDMQTARDVDMEVRMLEEQLANLRAEQEKAKQNMIKIQSMEERKRYEALGLQIQQTYKEIQSRSPNVTPTPEQPMHQYPTPHTHNAYSSSSASPYATGPSNSSPYPPQPQYFNTPTSYNPQNGSNSTTNTTSRYQEPHMYDPRVGDARSLDSRSFDTRSVDSQATFLDQGMMYMSSDSQSAIDSGLSVSGVSAASIEQEMKHLEMLQAAERASHVDSIKSDLMRLDADIISSRLQLDAAITTQKETVDKYNREKNELARQKLKYDPTQCLISKRMENYLHEKTCMDGVLRVMYEELDVLENQVVLKRKELSLLSVKEYSEYERKRDKTTDKINIRQRLKEVDLDFSPVNHSPRGGYGTNKLSVTTSPSEDSTLTMKSDVTPRTQRQQQLMLELDRLRGELEAVKSLRLDRQKSDTNARLQQSIHDIQRELQHLQMESPVKAKQFKFAFDDRQYNTNPAPAGRVMTAHSAAIMSSSNSGSAESVSNSTKRMSAAVTNMSSTSSEKSSAGIESSPAATGAGSFKMNAEVVSSEADTATAPEDDVEIHRKLAQEAEEKERMEKDRLEKLKAARLEARAALEAERKANEEAELKRLEMAKIENEKRARELAAIAKAQADRETALQAAAAAKEEADRFAAETALEMEQAKAAEVQRKKLFEEKMEAEKQAAAARAAALIEADRLEKFKQQQALAKKAEADRMAQEEANRQRQFELEQKRIAEEQEAARKLEIERKRIADAKAEADRLAAQKAELERQENLKREAEKQAAVKAEQAKKEAQRLAQLEIERQRTLAAERARLEEERLAAEKAEQDRIAAEKRRVKEASEAAERARIEAEKKAAERALQARLAAEQKAAEAARAAVLAAEEAARKAEADRLAAIQAKENKKAAIDRAVQADIQRKKVIAEFNSRKSIVMESASEAESNFMSSQSLILATERKFTELDNLAARLDVELKEAVKCKTDTLELNAIQQELEKVIGERKTLEESLQHFTEANIAAKAELQSLESRQSSVHASPLDQEIEIMDQSIGVEYSIIAALRIILLSYSADSVVEDGQPIVLLPKLADELRTLQSANVIVVQQKNAILDQIAQAKTSLSIMPPQKSRHTVSADPRSPIAYVQSSFNPRPAVQKEKESRGMNELERRLARRKASIDSSLAATSSEHA